MSDTDQTRDFWDSVADGFVATVIIAGVLFAIAVWDWQVYRWLRTGEWNALPFSAVFEYFEIDLSSVYAPSSWQGLAQVGRWVLALPLSVVLPVSGPMVAWLVRGFISRQ